MQVSLEPRALNVQPASTPALEWRGDLLVVGVFEECFETVGELKAATESKHEGLMAAII
jgi:hypothetical protein